MGILHLTDSKEYAEDLYRDIYRISGAWEIVYDPEENTFYDACGFAIFDIYNYISPTQLYLFLKNPQHVIVINPDDIIVEIFIEGEL